jgi:hypothetical protein
MIRIKHAVNPGDVIASLAGLKKLADDKGEQIAYYQVIGQIAAYYNGATHPTKDDNGRMVCMNEKMWAMLRPLLLSQPYIGEAEPYYGQDIDYDLNKIRGEINVNIPYGLIQKWTMLAFPEMSTDLSIPWMAIPDNPGIQKIVDGKILVNLTARYRNYNIDYFFLKRHQDNVLFIGTEDEHVSFCAQYKLDIDRLNVDNFLELAQAIRHCKFFMGNQSMAWNIAEAIKSPRLLEVCSWAQNCASVGPNGYDFMHQSGLVYLFNKLIS